MTQTDQPTASPRMDNPLVSVVVPLYNYGRFIENTIASVLGQTCGNVQLIIVNNGSTDDGPERVAAIKDPRLTLLHIKENRGPIPAWRLGFEHCKGEWFAMLPADDYWKPRKLERQFEYLRAHPDITMLGTWLEQVDEHGNPNGTLINYIERHCNRAIQFDSIDEWTWDHRLCIPSAIYRKDLCDLAGPPCLGMDHIADWEFHLRLLRSGGKAEVVPEPLTCYRWHGKNLSKSGLATCLPQWVWGFLTQYVPLARLWLKSQEDVENALADAISFLLDWPAFKVAPENHRLKCYYALLCSEDPAVKWPTYTDFVDWIRDEELAPSARAALSFLDEWKRPDFVASKPRMFATIYRIRHPKAGDDVTPEIERELMSKLGHGWYALYWAKHKITRPFKNLKRSTAKRLGRLELAPGPVVLIPTQSLAPPPRTAESRGNAAPAPRVAPGESAASPSPLPPVRQSEGKRPLVSVVVPLYNYGRYIENTIASVLGQTEGNLELIVVNNGSTDDGPERVAAIRDPRLTLLHIAKNQGPIPAWHLGFAHCKGEWFAMLPADDFWKPNKLERQFEYLRLHPEVSMLGTWIQQVDEHGNPNESLVPFIERHCNRTVQFDSLDAWRWNHRLCIPSALYRKDLCDLAGPPSLGMDHIADWEFHMRLLRAGGRVAVIPELLTYYRWHGRNLSKNGKFECLSQWVWGFLTEYVPLARQWLGSGEALARELADAISFFLTEPVFTNASDRERVMNYYGFLLAGTNALRWKSYAEYLDWVKYEEFAPAAVATLCMIEEWQAPGKLKRLRRGPWYTRFARRLRKNLGLRVEPRKLVTTSA